jgi:3-hydroxyacyl-[acyl-carrier-protein] dehydratase
MLMDLTRVLPHRPPMLLLDDVRAVEPGRHLTGLLTLPPDAAALPPYLVLESWLQAAAVLVALDSEPAGEPRLTLVGALRGVHLGRAAVAGETVAHRVEIVRSVADTAICTGVAMVGAEPVLRVGQATVVVRAEPG